MFAQVRDELKAEARSIEKGGLENLPQMLAALQFAFVFEDSELGSALHDALRVVLETSSLDGITPDQIGSSLSYLC